MKITRSWGCFKLSGESTWKTNNKRWTLNLWLVWRNGERRLLSIQFSKRQTSLWTTFTFNKIITWVTLTIFNTSRFGICLKHCCHDGSQLPLSSVPSDLPVYVRLSNPFIYFAMTDLRPNHLNIRQYGLKNMPPGKDSKNLTLPLPERTYHCYFYVSVTWYTSWHPRNYKHECRTIYLPLSFLLLFITIRCCLSDWFRYSESK